MHAVAPRCIPDRQRRKTEFVGKTTAWVSVLRQRADGDPTAVHDGMAGAVPEDDTEFWLWFTSIAVDMLNTDELVLYLFELCSADVANDRLTAWNAELTWRVLKKLAPGLDRLEPGVWAGDPASRLFWLTVHAYAPHTLRDRTSACIMHAAGDQGQRLREAARRTVRLCAFARAHGDLLDHSLMAKRPVDNATAAHVVGTSFSVACALPSRSTSHPASSLCRRALLPYIT